ncbi:CHASE2 domain-containing protein [Aquincola sp. J276]|uniref:CHASE2 domain-containing protein n=1 Tax=Aquincola sp. J276 TaxID=2898432 RepID=UPI002150D710|nr:CHASE2 domain-containing protein [Aquincola sp. J276]MCR5863849.1 CHASE2 domain-containing protein [Aquincola sp. J276]
MPATHRTGPALGHKVSPRHAALMLVIGLLLPLAIGLAGLLQPAWLARLEHGLQDELMRRTASGATAQQVVVVDIDDVSLAAVGQWPWPRYRVASLIERIHQAAPAAIAMDILFPEPDRSSLLTLQQTFKQDFGIDVAIGGVPPGLLDNDGYLGQQMARAGVVGARYFYFDHATPGAQPADAQPLQVGGRTDLLALQEATGVLENTAPVARRTRSSGFVNQKLDDDGVLRRLPLLIGHGGRPQVSLSLAAVMRAQGLRAVQVLATPDGLALQVGTRQLPMDAAGYATLRFDGGPASYPAVSAVALLAGQVPAEALRGKVVFVGTSAVGLKDVHTTAMHPAFPGLRIHALMAENLLQGRFVHTPPWGAAVALAACLATGLLMTAIFVLAIRIPTLVAASAVVPAAALGLAVALYLRSGLLLPMAAPCLSAGLLFMVFFITRYALERRRALAWRRQLENARQVTIESMASVAETRDPETGAHIKRTQHYVRAVALHLRATGHHTALLTDEYIELLFISAPLHDIGKVGVPDHILLKPGRLTPEEMEQMKQHAEFGRKIIFSTAQRIEGDNFLTIAGDIAATHHEKWDGSGYPLGLAGQDIPLAGRIMAVADIYDALISRRCYKEPFSHARATQMMRELRGKTFDPVVLDAFFEIEDTIQAIADEHRDEAEGDASPEVAAAQVIEGLKQHRPAPLPAAASIPRDHAQQP